MSGTKAFYDTIRPALFKGLISQSQVNGIEAILADWANRKITDQRYIAYSLGTVYHECGKTMQPVSEYGKGEGHDYGKMLKQGSGPGHRIPYTTPEQIYYGRGYVQLTWYENYQSFSRLLKIDLLNDPDLALQAPVAAQIMTEGMLNGDFTGKMLAQYFNDTTTDWVNARRIINGLDCATLIAGYAEIFYKGLTS